MLFKEDAPKDARLVSENFVRRDNIEINERWHILVFKRSNLDAIFLPLQSHGKEFGLVDLGHRRLEILGRNAKLFLVGHGIGRFSSRHFKSHKQLLPLREALCAGHRECC